MEEQGGIKLLKEYHRKKFGRNPEIVVGVPGRMDFLNTHQDYKGLPVVAIAVDRRLYMALSRGLSGRIRVYSWNLEAEGKQFYDEFSSRSPRLRGGKWFGDYLRAVTRYFGSRDISIDGLDVSVYSRIPIGSGMASSAAFTVAFVFIINHYYGLGLGKKEVAEIAFVAENKIMGIPCGRLDQYSIVYGGVTHIRTTPPVRVDDIPFPEKIEIYGVDTGIRHSTGDIHPRRQRELNHAVKLIHEQKSLPESLRVKFGGSFDDTQWNKITPEDLEELRGVLPNKLYDRIAYTVLADNSTRTIVESLKTNTHPRETLEDWASRLEDWGIKTQISGSIEDVVFLGSTYQHILLSELYDVSLPVIDEMVRGMLSSGFRGAKLSGAGLGGIILAFKTRYDEAVWKRGLLRLDVSGPPRVFFV